jgi:endoribonuclease L-PSP
MPTSRQAIVPGIWGDFYAETHIPPPCESATPCVLTGHTGEIADGVFSRDAEEQIRQVFRNINVTLAEAGVSWSDVVEISSYTSASCPRLKRLSGSPASS